MNVYEIILQVDSYFRVNPLRLALRLKYISILLRFDLRGIALHGLGGNGTATQGHPTCVAVLLIANSVRCHHLFNIMKNSILQVFP